MKRVLTWLGTGAVLFWGAVFVLYLSLRMGWFNDFLAAQVEEALSEATGMPVEIAHLSGVPLAWVKAEGVQIGSNDEPLFVLDALLLDYQFWPLLRGRVVVDTLQLVGPRVNLRQDANGQWVLPFESAPADTSSAQWWDTSVPLPVDLRHLEIVDGGAALHLATGLEQIQNLNLALGLYAEHTEYRLDLHRFQTAVFDPPLSVQDLSGLTLLQDGHLTFDQLRVQTPGSALGINGTVSRLSDPIFDMTVKTDSLSLVELARIMPGEYPAGPVAFSAVFKGPLAQLNAEIQVHLGELNAQIKGQLGLTDSLMSYAFEINAQNVDLMQLAPHLEQDVSFDLTSQISGQGVELADVSGQVDLRLAKVKALGASFDSIVLTSSLQSGKLQGRLDSRANMGRVSVDFSADVIGELPGYAIAAQLSNIDLSRLPGGSEEPTNLNGKIQARQLGLERWSGSAVFGALRFGDWNASNGVVEGMFDRGHVQLDTLGLGLPYGIVSAKGEMGLGHLWDTTQNKPFYRATIEVQDLDLGTATGQKDLVSRADVVLDVEGEGFEIDSASVNTMLSIQSDHFPGGRLDRARVAIRLKDGDLFLDELALSNALATINGRGRAHIDGAINIQIDGQVHKPEMLGDLSGIAIGGTPLVFAAAVLGTFELPDLDLTLSVDSLMTDGITLSNLGVSVKGVDVVEHKRGKGKVRVGKVLTGVHKFENIDLVATLDDGQVHFQIANASEDPLGGVVVGHLREFEPEIVVDLDSVFIRLDSLNLGSEKPSHIVYHPEKGVVVSDMRFSGSAGRLQIETPSQDADSIRVHLDDVVLGRWARWVGMTSAVAGKMDMTLLGSNLLHDPEAEISLNLDGGKISGFEFENLKGNLTYRDKRSNVNLKLVQRRGREVQVEADVPLNLQAETDADFFPEAQMNVSLQSEGIDLAFVQVFSEAVEKSTGTLEMNVAVSGTPTQPEVAGWLKVRDGGVHVIPLNQTFDRIAVDMSVEKNRIVLNQLRLGEKKGTLSLTGEVLLKPDDNTAFRARLLATDFQPINLPDLNATLRADLMLEGDLNAPRLSGNIEMVRAVIHVAPFLTPGDPNAEVPLFWQNLNVNLRVSAPRNVWIRDKNLNIEMSGDVDVRKDLLGLRVYGGLSSRRGRYDFQKTVFNLERGEIQFTGKPELDPDLFILATHRIRLTSGEPGVISILVGGTLLYPQITLESEPPMPTSDIFSYLLIGRPAESSGGTTSMEDRATGFVLGIAANQLKQKIGQRFNLDLVEIDAGTSGISRVRVGKYVGQKLFVSYTQEAEGRGNEVAIEYELLPQVTLEAQQRFEGDQNRQRQSLNVFWKREW